MWLHKAPLVFHRSTNNIFFLITTVASSQSFICLVMFVVSATLMQSHRVTFSASGNGLRAFLALFLLAVFVLGSGYSSSLVSVLTGAKN